MMTSNLMPVAANNDAELVNGTLAGNRDDFSQIVSRYQSLICSLAYSATGSLGQSEDLAQETFITAWKHLGHLRERDKLRAWLCGIARNRINSFLRREGREPNHQAGSIEEISESHSPEPLPVDHTISNEEQAILWRSLERIPEIYREPLVLFYREHQSIEAVAEKLELTEDNVKQRLSRGRKLLAEEVTAFVEGALAKTSPGKKFTLGVIAALPLASASAKAATLGGALAKAGAVAKGTTLIGSLGGLLATVGALYFSLRARVDDTKSPRERNFLQRMMGFQIVFYALLLGGFAAKGILFSGISSQPLAHDLALAVFFFLCIAHGAVLVDFISRRQRQIQIEDGTFDVAEWTQPRQETENRPGKTDGKSKLQKLFQASRFVIFSVVFMWTAQYWNFFHDSKLHANRSPVAVAVGLLVFCIVFGGMMVRGWQRSPRFLSVTRPGQRYGVVIAFGLLTLLGFNLHQAKLPVADTATATTVIIFNTVTVLAYASLVGILIRNRPPATPAVR